LKKLEFDGTISEIIDLIEENGFEIIPINGAHVIEYEEFAFYHRYPFDKMLVVKAMVEDLIILTKDENSPRYNVNAQWYNCPIMRASCGPG
jgi:PIN domain nuclease of toxin-antitoxin system